MAIKDLQKMLDRYKAGEIATADDFEKELNKALPEDWVPKATYNELSDKHKLSEKQLKEATDQLSGLKDKAGLADEYKAQIDQLTAAQEAEKEGFEKQLVDMRHGYALDEALRGARARNVRAVKAMLDMDRITWEGDAIKGLDEQLKAIRESDGYLFEEQGGTGPQEPTSTKKPTFGSTKNQSPQNTAPSGLEAQMRHAAGLD